MKITPTCSVSKLMFHVDQQCQWLIILCNRVVKLSWTCGLIGKIRQL